MVKLLDLQAITMQHGDEYKAAANRVIESGWFLQGNENKQFEKDYAQYIGTDECVAVANGLDALRLIIRGYKELSIFQEGDEIIVPEPAYANYMSFAVSAGAVIRTVTTTIEE